MKILTTKAGDNALTETDRPKTLLLLQEECVSLSVYICPWVNLNSLSEYTHGPYGLCAASYKN